MNYFSQAACPATIRVMATIYGEVQGVSFRKQTMAKALELNVYGWVKNLDDGSVSACFEGKKSSVDALVNWCFLGPERALVRSLECQSEVYTGEFKDFCILSDDSLDAVSWGHDQRSSYPV